MVLGDLGTHEQRTAVCVLGMHRSGTSALTGCLEAHGLVLGNVVRAAPHNERGNNENLEIRELHDQVLADCGGGWDKPPETVVWHPKRKHALRQIIIGFANETRWGFKDPRTLLTLDAWLEEIPHLALVGTFRNPRHVINSLIARQPSFPPDQALQLWMTYNEKLLHLVEHGGAQTVCFDLSNEDYLRSVRKLALAIGLRKETTADYFTPHLRHWNERGWHGIPDEVHVLYDRLCELSVSSRQSRHHA